MKYVIMGLAVSLASAAMLTGCAGAQWKAGASCDTTKKCEVHGEISGTIPNFRFANMQLVASAVADAAQFEVDVSGSTIPYPSTGTVNIILTNSSTGTTVAAHVFGWTKSGNIIRLSDPNGVNTWATANAGSADTVTYRMVKFQSNYAPGNQTIAVKSKYEGVVKASATTTFEACTPPGQHSPYPCAV